MRFKSGRFSMIFTAAVFCLAGLLMFGLGIYSLYNNHVSDIVYNEVECIIVKIDEYREASDDEITHTVYVNYEVKGIQYEMVEYGAWNSGMHVGDRITALYNVDDPSFIQIPGYKRVPYYVMGGSVIFMAIGFFLLLRTARTYN